MIKATLVLIATLLGLQQINRKQEYLRGTATLYDEYDYIVVGGGTTGLVIASRLTENANTTVLIIEAGGSDYGSAFHESAWLVIYSLTGGTAREWGFTSTPQETSKALNGRKVLLPSGKVLGGTSSINGALYLRPSKHDLDSWADHGAMGWGWDDIVKYFHKIENATVPIEDEGLGKSGNVRLSFTFQSRLTEWAKSAASALGLASVNKYVLGSIDGITKYLGNEYKGDRQSSSVSYFWPVWDERSSRLHLSLNSLVDKVIIETDETTGEKLATGVQFIKGDITRTIRARKEVIVSCGAYGTPQVLMRSGIGPRKHLEELNIPVIVDSPGVGSNLQDHPAFTQNWYSDSIPEDVCVDIKRVFSDFTGYQTHGNTPLKSAGPVTANLHIRTKLAGTNASLSTNFFIKLNLLHPKSTGTVRLQSSDPMDIPAIDTRYLSNTDDRKVILEGFRFLETFIQQKPFSDYNLTLVAQPYCNTKENNKVPRSDEFYNCLMDTTTMAERHPCCTAKMGKDSDPMAVLDSKLRVRGVSNLRVADASAMPHIVSSNPMSACLLIGEKASEMIKEDNGHQ